MPDFLSNKWYTVSETEKKPHRILKEFDVNSSLRLLAFKERTDLPPVKFSGDLPRFKAYVSQEKIKNSLVIVNEISSAFAAPPVSEKSTWSSDSESDSELLVVKGALDSEFARSDSSVKVGKDTVQMEMEFKMGTVAITVFLDDQTVPPTTTAPSSTLSTSSSSTLSSSSSSTISSSSSSSLSSSLTTSSIIMASTPSHVPKVTLKWVDFGGRIVLTKYTRNVTCSLKQFAMIDSIFARTTLEENSTEKAAKKFMIQTSDKTRAFEFSYFGVDPTTPLSLMGSFNLGPESEKRLTDDGKSDHTIRTVISEISITVNRPTVARLLLFVEHIQQTMTATISPAQATNAQAVFSDNIPENIKLIATNLGPENSAVDTDSSLTSPSTTPKLPLFSTRPLLLSLSVTLDGLQLTFLKNSQPFLEGHMTGISSSVLVRHDDTLIVSGSLSTVSLKDAYKSPWSHLIQTSGKENVVEFSYENFLRGNEFDMGIKVKMASMSACLTSRLVLKIILSIFPYRFS